MKWIDREEPRRTDETVSQAHVLSAVVVFCRQVGWLAADVLGMSRLTLSNLVNGKNGVSPEMAILLSKALGASPQVWLGMQMQYDLAQAEKKAATIKVKRAPVPA